MKLAFYKNDNKITLELSKMNIFYGYSGSGKTTFAKALEQGLLGKDKSFSLNGLSILKDEFNVLFIDSKESILEHLKLTSKSYFKKLYYNKVLNYLNDHQDLFDEFNENFKQLNQELDEIANIFNKNSYSNTLKINFEINDFDKIIDTFINIELENKNISTALAKEMLIKLITIISNEDKPYHIILDDFDAFLDEQTTINIFNSLNSFNGNFYLFTSKPNSLLYSIDKYNIYNLRENKILNFSNLSYMYKSFMQDSLVIENKTYEEYMLNYGYFSTSGLEDTSYLKIKNNSVYNLGRMLTNRSYKIINTIDDSNICITPYDKFEYDFLTYIDNLINND